MEKSGSPGSTIALLSDVHANLPALEEVMRALKGRGVEAILHAGDIVGYNPYPAQVIEVFRREAIATIAGNHDRAVIATGRSLASGYWFNDVAAAALEWTRGRLSRAHREFLRGLPARMKREVRSRPLLMVHGSPRDDDEYVYEEDVDGTLLQGLHVDILAMGHTHVPYVLRRGPILVVNPGSVGQPRDGDPRASFALVEPEEPRAEVIRVPYPAKEVGEAILAAGLPAFLAHRLELGR